MAGPVEKRVAVIDPDGNFGTLPESQIDQLPDGARVLSRQEEAEAKLDADYENQDALTRTVGVLSGAATPQIEAWRTAAGRGLTAGIEGAVTRKVLDAVDSTGQAGQKFAERTGDLEAAYPATSVAGETAGVVGGAAISAASGTGVASRLLPAGAISAAGAPVEHVVERGLAGLAAKGALGRAAATAASLGARGAVEGGIYSGLEQASSNVLNNRPTGEKLYAAMGHGALTGGGLGAILGFGGSLGASGARAASSKIARAFGRGGNASAEAASELASQQAAGVPVPFLSASDLEAGIREPLPAAESPFSVGGEFATLKPGGKTRAVPTEPAIDITGRMSIDPDAGIYAPEGAVTEPLFSRFSQGATKAKRRAAVEAGMFPGAEKGHNVQLAADAFKASKVATGPRPIRQRFDVGIEPDAGIAERGASGRFQGPIATEDAVIPANRKGVRRVDMADVEGELPEAPSPIRASAEEGSAATGPKLGGVVDALNNPTNAARGFAQDQAWKAVGGGFGLQTTKFAKQATRYLPNGTRDLGEIAIRHGIVDMGDQAATPLQAALTAAKSGTPAEMVPRITTAKESVGRQLGEIADASGGRIHEDQLRKLFQDVRSRYDRIAGNEHVVDAIDRYAESLGTKLRTAPDGTISVQDLLEQRKGLGDIVYNEAPLDPGRRVQALRDIHGKVEDLIEDAIDGASGRVPGELKAKYKALKRDYTGLRILEEAAKDSAARASKAATFGFAEKMAALTGLASGHVGAPVLAVGSKLVKERGNAAAAAFLTRAADSGMIETAVSRFNARVKQAASGVLREPAADSPRARPKQLPEGEALSREQAREQVFETQKKAQAIVKWLGDARANPQRIMDQVKEASAIVGRAAGPQAAESYTAATLRAISFIAGHIPIRERRDPLDPRSVPPLTFDEADRLIRAAKYATHPETVYDDFEKGVITPEGLRAANTFTPDDFKEFQLELQQHVENRMLKGKMLTQSQRLRLDKLLPYPAGPDFKQANIARLQANLMKAPPEPTPADPTGGGPLPPPVDLKVQQSGFDAIEARMAG